MKKSSYALIIASAGVVLLTCLGYGLLSGNAEDKAVENATPSVSVRAERVDVVHFHATQQCYSCKKVGELAFRTIKERFSNEWKDGIIRFLDVNGELPENRDMVVKFQASGSSLFLNGIAGGEDHIQEEVTVWRLISDDQKFMDYLEGRIRAMMDKGI